MPSANNADAVTVAILAGGAARRLGGRDKGLEPLHGRALVDHVLAAIVRMRVDAQAIAQHQVLIVANRHRDDYAQRARTIADTVQGFAGPLAGVAAALAACETPWLMTLPVDCPQPPLDLAGRLFAAAIQANADAMVAHDGERRQPLFALYRSTLAASAGLAAAAGQGVWAWQSAIGVHELDFTDARRQFLNLNTFDEFAARAADRAHDA